MRNGGSDLGRDLDHLPRGKLSLNPQKRAGANRDAHVGCGVASCERDTHPSVAGCIPRYKVTWLLLFLEFQGGVGCGRFRPAEDLSLFLAPQPGRLLELKPGGWELGMGLPETGGLAAPAGSWLWGKLPPRVGTIKVMEGPVLQGGNWFPLRFTGSSWGFGQQVCVDSM